MALVDNIRQDLKAKIREQVFRTGEFLPTFQKLASTYQTSTNSVYRAIKQLERENMVLAVKGSGTKVIYSSPANSGKTAASRYVGLVISEPGRDSATMQLLTGIQEGLEKQGRHCIVKFSHKNLEEEKKVVLDLKRDGVNDIILYPSLANYDDLKNRVELFMREGIQLTFINYYRTGLTRSAVCVDNYWGIYNLCRSMHDDGAEKFVFMSYEIDRPAFDFAIHERTTAFREYVRSNDLPSEIIYLPNSENFADDDERIQRFFEHVKTPGTAIVCMNDVIGKRLGKMMMHKNIAWPDSLFFGAFGNLDSFPYPLYEARIDFYHFGLELARACVAGSDNSHGKRLIIDAVTVSPRG